LAWSLQSVFALGSGGRRYEYDLHIPDFAAVGRIGLAPPGTERPAAGRKKTITLEIGARPGEGAVGVNCVGRLRTRLGDLAMWILMLLLGLATFAAMYGFVFACDRL
jgi:hypothetical protein